MKTRDTIGWRRGVATNRPNWRPRKSPPETSGPTRNPRTHRACGEPTSQEEAILAKEILRAVASGFRAEGPACCANLPGIGRVKDPAPLTLSERLKFGYADA